MDLTTLSGDDTPGRVRRLCAKARRPVRADLLEAMGAEQLPIRVAAVCVYRTFVQTAVEALDGSGILVAAVSTGFRRDFRPSNSGSPKSRSSVAAGAEEIDVVMSRAHVLTGNWSALHHEVRTMREACGDAHIKTILATGELATLRNVGRASLVCMMAGADFIKTSTGKESVNATLPVGLVMARAIREYRERTGDVIGLKPAGGIRAAREALDWLALVKDELATAGFDPTCSASAQAVCSRTSSASSQHFVTGRYSVRSPTPHGVTRPISSFAPAPGPFFHHRDKGHRGILVPRVSRHRVIRYCRKNSGVGSVCVWSSNSTAHPHNVLVEPNSRCRELSYWTIPLCPSCLCGELFRS